MVSDSEYISDENMCICPKIDVDINGKSRAINIYRESIKPNTKIAFSITIDTEKFIYGKEDIENKIKNDIEVFYNNYLSKFNNSFKIGKPSDKKYTCFLGGGVGFVSKTIWYNVLEKREAVKKISKVLNMKFKQHKHREDKEVSPRMIKCTEYKDVTYQFGVCFLSKFEEVKLG